MSMTGCSYVKRIKEVNEIYDEYARTGLSNRMIWRKYIWPIFGITERTMYNYINKSSNPKVIKKQKELQLSFFTELE